MGTSTTYGGPRGDTPLIPSWLDNTAGTGPSPDQDGADPPNPNDSPTPPDKTPIPKPADSNRFSGARGNFTRFARSGGSDRASLGRAISNYVSTSSGGARQAAQRMGASRGAGARLLGFLSDANTRGIREALREFNLESMAGLPISEVFVALADHICPGAGTVDEGIAREAYIETIIDLAGEGLASLDSFTPEQMDTVFELYATHAIEARICNDIGTKLVSMPSNAKIAHQVEKQLQDFIRGAVSDALIKAREGKPNITNDQALAFVDSVYESAFAILKSLGDAEADQ
ncbi:MULTISPECIES: Qat anti-phage system associated protein QatB [Providencia]|uniref:Qat anti-phage system associated protein QatB n=1 Tax=Providencia TaxID=586 RepID=UPI001181E7F0|nr:Qat anti-phage system associated protein QatB [Providencia rettgeri]